MALTYLGAPVAFGAPIAPLPYGTFAPLPGVNNLGPQFVDPRLLQGALAGQNQLYGNWAAFLGAPAAAFPQAQLGVQDPLLAQLLAQQQASLAMWQGIVTQAAGNLGTGIGIAMASLAVNDVQAQLIDGYLGSNIRGWMNSGTSPLPRMF
ncbi:MAG: hypothetical protein HY319_03035 [Armatimonadetes bacterium]|nr:hypothetical protein [Armatimonadota bacterium]